jgi:zinc/manganese transport system substrate-binding protein
MLWLLLAVLPAHRLDAALNVVATTPEIASLARDIGGNRITVTSLAKPTEDPHFVDAKPSFITKLNQADALVEGGADLEAGWLTPLLDGSRNPKIATSAPGRIVCAHGIDLLDVPTQLDRSKGDLHALGNPHFMMDPANAGIVARHLADSLSKLDPGSQDLYRDNLNRFLARLERKRIEWEQLLRPHQGRHIVAYHNTWPYFARRFKLASDLFLEPKPGLPPTPAHLAEVIRTMKATKVGVIIVEPYQNRRTAETVAKETGAKVVDFAQYPGGIKGTEAGYLDLIDTLVKSLANAFAASPAL